MTCRRLARRHGEVFALQIEADGPASSLRSTLDIYTQAITPAKYAGQAAVLSLVFSAESNGASRAEAPALSAHHAGALPLIASRFVLARYNLTVLLIGQDTIETQNGYGLPHSSGRAAPIDRPRS